MTITLTQNRLAGMSRETAETYYNNLGINWANLAMALARIEVVQIHGRWSMVCGFDSDYVDDDDSVGMILLAIENDHDLFTKID